MMRIPAYMFSDILNVAYSYDWIRLPDMYGVVPYDKYTGVELSYDFHFNNLLVTSTLLFGKTENQGKVVQDNGALLEVDTSADDMYVAILNVLYHDLSVRVAYSQSSFTFSSQEVNGILSQFNAMGIPSISNAIEKYKIEDTLLSYFNIGARYDFSNSYLLGEYIQVDSHSFLPDISSWYIGSGYNFETWTPFILYSQLKNRSNYQVLSTEGIPAQLMGATVMANQTFSALSTLPEVNMKSLSLGVRYDLSEDILLKFQYDNHQRLEERLDVFSGAINFVF